MTDSAPEGKRQSSRLLAVLGFGFFINSAEDVALPMLFPSIRGALGLGVDALGLITGTRIIFQTLSGPLWGMAADRYSRKRILIIGAGLWGMLTGVCGLTFTFTQLFIAHVVACIGLGCLYPAAFGMIADTFGPNHRGKALGIISAVGMLGIVIGALVFGILVGASETGWRWAFLVLGLTSGLSAVLIAVGIREPVRGGAEPELEHIIDAQGARQFQFDKAGFGRIFKCRTVLVSFLQGIFLLTTINSLVTYFPTWLVDDRHFSESRAMLAFAMVVLALAAGSVVGGIVADAADRSYPRYGRIVVSQLSILATLPALFLLLTRASSPVGIVACASWAGFFIDWTRRGVVQPLLQNTTLPELRSTVMALTEFVNGAAASVIIIMFSGYAKQHGLTATLMFLGCGAWAAAFIATVLYYLVYPLDAERLCVEMQRRSQQLLAQTPGENYNR